MDGNLQVLEIESFGSQAHKQQQQLKPRWGGNLSDLSGSAVNLELAVPLVVSGCSIYSGLALKTPS